MKELFKTIIRDWQKAKIVRALQVCLTSQDEVTRQRELRGIVQAAQCFGLAEGYIITLDAERRWKWKALRLSCSLVGSGYWRAREWCYF